MVSKIIDWARQSPADDFWMCVGVLGVIALAGFLGAFYFFSRKRMMENTPTSRIRSAAQGFVELEGTGLLMEGLPIRAPLSGMNCLWYQYEIAEYRRSGKNSSWHTIDKGISDNLFLLRDATGQCVVDPDGARVTHSEKNVWYGKSSRPTSGPRARGGMFFSLGQGKFRYTERRIHPGDPVYAIGLFKTIGGVNTELDTDMEVRELLREWKSNSTEMLEKFDKNQDGTIDMEEWQSVREAALQEVMKHHGEIKSTPPVHTLSRTMDKRRTFIISATPQAQLIKRFHWYAVGLLVLFFLGGTISTWLVNLRLGSGS